MGKSSETVLLAIDAFDPKASRLKQAAGTIQTLIRQGHYAVQVASAISPDQVSWPSNFPIEWGEKFRLLGESTLKKSAKSLGFKL